jgi:hypothetical protein
MSENTRIARIEDALDRPIANAIVVRKGGSGNFGSMGEVMEFSKLMSLSRQAIPKDLRESPGLCLGVVMQAIAWEMEPFAVARQAFVINDTVCYGSQLLHAVVEARAPLQRRLRCTYSGDGPDRQCTVSGLLHGETEPHEYTSPKLKDIPIKNSPLWKWDADQQLFYLSSRAWARKWVPDVLMGVYAPDEAKYAGEAARTFDRVENPLGPDDPDALVPPKQIDHDVTSGKDLQENGQRMREEVMPPVIRSYQNNSPTDARPPGATGAGVDVALEQQPTGAAAVTAGEPEGMAATEQPTAAESEPAKAARKPRGKEMSPAAAAVAAAQGLNPPGARIVDPKSAKPESPKHPDAVMPPPHANRWGGEQYLCYLREWTEAAVAVKSPAAYVTERGKREMSLRNNLGTILTHLQRTEVAAILQSAASKCP